jgi:hypothetical protein
MLNSKNVCDTIKCHIITCNKKLTFMEKNTCLCNKCNIYYCTKHRLPEIHLCSYDFTKDVDKEKFITDNKCVADKIIKI